jgi:hypothetical protein
MNISVCLESDFVDCPFLVTKVYEFFITESFKVKQVRNHQEKISILNCDKPDQLPRNVILLHTHNYKKNLLIDANTKEAIGVINEYNLFKCQIHF